MKNRYSIVLLILALAAASLGADEVSINQIDTAELFTLSRIDAYVSVQGSADTAEASDFEVYHETSTGMVPVPVIRAERNEESKEGMTFFLLLDNSGSMYLPIGGGLEGTRMDHALRGIQSFLSDLSNPEDIVGFAAFNTLYTSLAEPSDNLRVTGEALATVEEPESDMAFTEIYYSLTEATGEISRYNGRKAIIILSDGENRPYSPETGNPHPDFGEKDWTSEEALELLKQEEITLYVINFAPEKDEPLARIALESGGMVFDARNQEELTNVYSTIKESIEQEYRLTLGVPLTFVNDPEIEVSINGASGSKEYSPRFIFGKPGDKPLWFFLLFLIGALLLWIILLLMKLEKPAKSAELQLLGAGAGKAPQRTVVISDNKTVIGAAPQADFTVAGVPSMRDSHATIIQDPNSGAFTLISDAAVMVNNKPAKKRKLNPGDVINVEGATIIFDAPEKKK
jgi:Ca-activated chloride channel family protein